MISEQKDSVYMAALAGLLHDIGKFAQRANWGRGKHAEVGGEFVRQYVPQQWREYLYPVMGHHDKPLPDHQTKLVALADRLSAGEREEQTEQQPKQLLSIFCRLETESPDSGVGYEHAPRALYWPLHALALDKAVLFPGELHSAEQVQAGYEQLWEDFERDVRILQDVHAQDGNIEVYLESLLLLMQRYTWCIPSAYYRSLPDVSLYDHSRTTAALAACLKETPEAKLDAMLDNPHQDRSPVALLVGGDISGVQDFIYTITDRGATSALRGRSFYLQLLTEAVVRFVLHELALPVTNLVYQGGGGFYLLARPDDQTQLTDVQRQISQVLLDHHRGELYLALAAEPLRAADFYGGRIASKWETLAQSQRDVKQRRFAELPAGELEKLFGPQGHGGNEEQQCQVCGHEHDDVDEETGSGEIVRKCPQCRSYEELGRDLRQAQYLWLERVTPPPSSQKPDKAGDWPRVLAALGARGGVIKDLKSLPNDGDGARVILALQDDALCDLHPGQRTAVGRRFLVNTTPTITQEEIDQLQGRCEDLPKAGSVKPFSAMAEQACGIRRLGALRMDIDSLGTLFSDGFTLHKADGTEEHVATLSRVATLSFAISLYFEGWVEKIASALNQRTKEQDRDELRGELLYSIYSGGDDLFFVGAWDSVVELARWVRRDFTRFAAEHPGLHTSAGLVLVGGKYPLAQAAADAGEAEHQAKSLRWYDADGHVHTKDAFSFLGQTLPWMRFGLENGATQGGDIVPDTVYGLKNKLLDLVQSKDAPSALLHELIRLQMQVEEAARVRRRCGDELTRAGQAQILWGPWMWQGYYKLKRMARQHNMICKLADKLHDDNFRAITWMGLAARWADLLTR